MAILRPKTNPFCPRCETHHFNFNPCLGVKIHSPAVQLRRPRDGFLDVTDRLSSRVVVGANTFGNVRRPIHSETAA